MALVKCPSCGNTVSDKALNCPHCGVKFVHETQSEVNGPSAMVMNVLTMLSFVGAIVCFLLLILL